MGRGSFKCCNPLPKCPIEGLWQWHLFEDRWDMPRCIRNQAEPKRLQFSFHFNFQVGYNTRTEGKPLLTHYLLIDYLFYRIMAFLLDWGKMNKWTKQKTTYCPCFSGEAGPAPMPMTEPDQQWKLVSGFPGPSTGWKLGFVLNRYLFPFEHFYLNNYGHAGFTTITSVHILLRSNQARSHFGAGWLVPAAARRQQSALTPTACSHSVLAHSCHAG